MAKIAAQLEGIIQALPTKDGAGNATFQVMGVPVVVSPSAEARRRIRTTTGQKRMTINQLVDPTPLPGRSQPGFVGCTAVVAGNYDTVAKFLEVAYPPTIPAGLPADPPFEFHPFVESGPPEALLLGPCTANAGGKIAVNDIPVEILGAASDPKGRFIPDEPANEFGIKISVSRIPLNAPVSVEGYPSSDTGPTRFIGFAVVVDSNDPTLLVDSINPQVGITRAQGRNRRALFDLEVRGGVYTGQPSGATIAPQRITIQRLDAAGNVEGDPNGILSARADAPPGGFDKWTANKPLTPTPPFLTAPVGVQATYVNAPSGLPIDQEPDVEIRDDPKTPPTATTPP